LVLIAGGQPTTFSTSLKGRPVEGKGKRQYVEREVLKRNLRKGTEQGKKGEIHTLLRENRPHGLVKGGLGSGEPDPSGGGGGKIEQKSFVPNIPVPTTETHLPDQRPETKKSY